VIDEGDDAFLVHEKPLNDAVGNDVETHHLAALVDADDLGGPGSRVVWDVDRAEDASVQQEPVAWSDIVHEEAHDSDCSGWIETTCAAGGGRAYPGDRVWHAHAVVRLLVDARSRDAGFGHGGQPHEASGDGQRVQDASGDGVLLTHVYGWACWSGLRGAPRSQPQVLPEM
jgi:hypothetical protein